MIFKIDQSLNNSREKILSEVGQAGEGSNVSYIFVEFFIGTGMFPHRQQSEDQIVTECLNN